MSSSKFKSGRIESLTDSQKRLLEQQTALGQSGLDLQAMLLGQAGAAIPQIMAGFDPERSREMFERTVGDPARRRFREESLPELLQMFASGDEKIGSPVAAQLATRGLSDLEGQLAGAEGQYFQNQQAAALQQLLGLSGAAAQPGATSLGTQGFQPFGIRQPSTMEQAGSFVDLLSKIINLPNPLSGIGSAPKGNSAGGSTNPFILG